MYSALSLENLAKVIHTDKQHRFVQANFVRQLEQAQTPTGSTHWGQAFGLCRQITTHQWFVTFVMRPVRLVWQLAD